MVLLLHAGIGIFLFITLKNTDRSPFSAPPSFDQPHLDDHYQLVQHLRAGTPGAPSVIFQNPTAKPAKEETQPQAEPTPPVIPPDMQAANDTPTPREQAQPTSEQRLQNDIAPHQTAGMIPLTQYAQKAQDTDDVLEKKDKPEIRKEPLLGKAALMKKNMRITPARPSSSVPGNRNASKLTFAQLVDGFNTAKARDDAAASIMGAEGMVDAKQMVFENYCRKIEQCLKITNSIHRQKFNDLDPKELISAVYIELQPNGSLVTNQLIHSSGNSYADGLALFLFQESASSFPPVPPSLSQGNFPMRWRIHFNASNTFGFQLSR